MRASRLTIPTVDVRTRAPRTQTGDIVRHEVGTMVHRTSLRIGVCALWLTCSTMNCKRQLASRITSDREPTEDVPASLDASMAARHEALGERVIVDVPARELPRCEWRGLGRQTPLPTELRPLRCGPVEWFVGSCIMHCIDPRTFNRRPGQRCMDPCGVWLHHTGLSCWMGIGVHPEQLDLRIQDGRVKLDGLARYGGRISIDENFRCETGYPFEIVETTR